MSVIFEDNSMQCINALDSICDAWLYEAAGELEAQTKRNSRSDTGQAKNSYEYRVDNANQKAYIGSNLENAIWEEFGTGEYALNNDGRKTPWYVPVEKATGKKKPTYQGQVIVVYGKDGQAFYKTDGKSPNRPLFRAFEKLEAKLKKRLQALLAEGMK